MESLSFKARSDKQTKKYFEEVEDKLKVLPVDIRKLVNQAVSTTMGEAPEHLICTICLGLVYEPQECSQCENPFCAICIDEWFQNNEACPTCNKKQKLRNMHKFLRGQLNEMQVTCLCKEELTYEELAANHAAKCVKKEVNCPLECGATIAAVSESARHFDQCPKVIHECLKCKQVLRRDQMSVHSSDCPDEYENCNQCQQYFKRKEQKAHVEICPESQMECKKCFQTFFRKFEDQHLKLCPEATIKCQRCQTEYIRNDENTHDCITSVFDMLKLQSKQIEDLYLQNWKQEVQYNSKLQQAELNLTSKLKQKDSEIKGLNNKLKELQSSIFCKNVMGNEHRWKYGHCQGRKCLFCKRDENYKNSCVWSLGKINGQRKCVDCERPEEI